MGANMGGGFLRGAAYLVLAATVALTSCQAAVPGAGLPL
jgi:hypothetical protein